LLKILPMKSKTPFRSALNVNAGVEQPPPVNPTSLERFLKTRRKSMTVSDYMEGILSGNRTVLSQAITLVESSLPAHIAMAQQIIEQCLPHSGKSVRIGITGVPGAGKSTLIESFGTYLTTTAGRKLAVLAIDPSSERTRGSIMGDKTRMEQLSLQPNAFIRPSPSAGSLGGVARKTRETIFLCEAAGYDTILVETVGVGQSETVVHSMTDFFLLLMIPGAGDELQGIKRGIMEMADLIAINKADGTNMPKASLARAQYQSALKLFPAAESGWEPRVLTCSAVYSTGIPELWESILDYESLTRENGYFERRRSQQSRYWLYETLDNSLRNHFYQQPRIRTLIQEYEQSVLQKRISSFAAAQALLDHYLNHLHPKTK